MTRLKSAKNDQLVEQLLFRSWWVIVLFCVMFFSFDRALDKKKQNIALFEEKLENLSLEKEKALAVKEDLSLRIQSQSDPEWVEMVLKKQLGLVSEGFLKIHFSDEN